MGEWDAAGERCLRFATPLELPAVLKKLLGGGGAVRVTERQRRATAPDGTPTITSTPVPDLPGGAKFATVAQLSFRRRGSGCRVRRARGGTQMRTTCL